MTLSENLIDRWDHGRWSLGNSMPWRRTRTWRTSLRRGGKERCMDAMIGYNEPYKWICIYAYIYICI
jgi:ribosomal protein L32E